MALITCPECNTEVSKTAEACPKCGAPIKKLLAKKRSNRMWLYLFGFLGFFVLVGQCAGSMNESSDQAERAEQAKMAAVQKQRAEDGKKKEWADKAPQIKTDIQAALDAGDPAKAEKLAVGWVKYGDDELKELLRQARIGVQLAVAKALPAKNIDANKGVYAQLVSLDPDNATYKKKLAHYQAKIDEREAKQKAYLAKNGKAPSRSGFTGRSYFAVDQYLEAVANDPDSIDVEGCTDSYRNPEGWVVGCTYRGKNAFGATVKNANWFVIHHDRVVTMKPADAYQW